MQNHDTSFTNELQVVFQRHTRYRYRKKTLSIFRYMKILLATDGSIWWYFPWLWRSPARFCFCYHCRWSYRSALNSGQLSTICPNIAHTHSLQEKETLWLRGFSSWRVPWFTTKNGREIELYTPNTSNRTQSKTPLLGTGPMFNFWSSLDVSSSAASDSKKQQRQRQQPEKRHPHANPSSLPSAMRLVEPLACAQSKQQQLQLQQQQQKKIITTTFHYIH